MRSAPPPRPIGLGIGAGLRRHAEALMDQQMWCFGRDIRHPDGNALLRFGFEAVRPPRDTVGGTAYTWTPAPGDRLTLWAFGLCYAGATGEGLIHLNRFRFRPGWRAEVDLPRPAWDTLHLPAFRVPRVEGEWRRVRRLTARALDAVAVYEEWAGANLGPDHRGACVASWFKARTAPSRVAPSWRSLARRVGRDVA